MFHKNLSPAVNHKAPLWTQTNTPRLKLVSSDSTQPSPAQPKSTSSALRDLLAISAERCGSFFAEAAVLVLVLAILDRFMLKGNLEPRWIVGAIALSTALLSASIATSFSARRWLRPHP